MRLITWLGRSPAMAYLPFMTHPEAHAILAELGDDPVREWRTVIEHAAQPPEQHRILQLVSGEGHETEHQELHICRGFVVTVEWKRLQWLCRVIVVMSDDPMRYARIVTHDRFFGPWRSRIVGIRLPGNVVWPLPIPVEG